jgi:hypothetical protein
MNEVRLCVPEGFLYQLIYRLDRREPYATSPLDGMTFELCATLGQYMQHRREIKRIVGAKEYYKGILRMMKGRYFYCIHHSGILMRTGWVTISDCKHYKIGERDVVIGQLWTADAARGKGLATEATKRVINEMIRKNHHIFFIDTTNDNASCLRMIEKCEFGAPVASYLRSTS